MKWTVLQYVEGVSRSVLSVNLCTLFKNKDAFYVIIQSDKMSTLCIEKVLSK